MKKMLLKSALVSLGCAGALNAFALTALEQSPATFGNLPFYFEAHPGPVDDSTQFIVHGRDYLFLISPDGVRLDLEKMDAATKKTSVRTVHMQFMGARSQAQIQGADELSGKINYFVGDNPTQWRTDVATFARVRVGQLYPGINLSYYGNQRQLEYDFTLAPGADPNAIKIHFDGVDKIWIGPRGELILAVGRNKILQPAPMVYQTIDGARKAVSGGYRLTGAHTVAFVIGQYDHGLPLVIDPILSYSTYFGGNASDAAWSIAVDTNGFIYIAGQTLSGQFYPTPGAFQTNFAGGGVTGDAFVAKFGNQGTNLVYLTYLGGSSDDLAASVAVDGAGDAYVTGYTDSTDFPTTSNALSRSILLSPTPLGYLSDAFVAKLDPSGSNLLYSTFLGGDGADGGTGIALDSSNNIYVTGFTYSTNFPTTPNAFQKNLACPYSIYTGYLYNNAFLTEIGAAGTNLVYSSYFGGTNYDVGEGVAVDSSNNVYVTGYTASTNFPNTNAFQQYLNGATNNLTPAYDAFVAKFTPSCTSLVYSTFLGGTNNDAAYRVAADDAGNAYVTGWTVSTNFPDTATNVPGLYNGLTNNVYGYPPIITNAFLTQITWNGTNAAIGYSAVFGGTNYGADIGYGVALDPSGDAFVVGASSTTNFPAVNTPGLLSTTNAGGSDVFVIAFNTNCSAVLYSGLMGGSANDYGYGIAVDAQTNAYITGATSSPNFPLFNNPGQTSLRGSSDAFLAEIGWAIVPPEITTQPTNQALWTGTSTSFSATATGTIPLSYQWQLDGTNLTNGTNIFGSTISGATNSTLNIINLHTNDSGNYQIIVTNYGGSVTSLVAVLTVTNGPPVITLQPTNQLMVETSNTATFSVTANGSPPLDYQWQFDGTNLTDGTTTNGTTISGSTNSSLYIYSVLTNDSGNYQVVITNGYGSVTSSVSVLAVTSAPFLTLQPTNQTVGVGSTVTFSVDGYATAPYVLQWQKDGADLVNGTNSSGSIISGATNANLTIANAQTDDDGNYWFIVSSDYGAVTSSVAVLTVLTAPNFTGITAGTNGGFVLSGVGGTNSGTYFVLASTNLATPLNLWTPVATNLFGSQGQFTFTNTPPTNAPQQFYLLQMQSP
jgi:Immunoglobulin domain/Immunoglobulin I-set domain/Beta-propeller repeat